MKYLMIFSLLFILTSCFVPKVLSDQKADTKWSQYGTYRVCPYFPKVTSMGTESPDLVTLLNIRSSIEASMKDQPLELNEENPSVEIGFEVITKVNESKVLNCKVENDADYFPTCKFETYVFTEGFLLIHMTDLEANEIVWQGAVKGEIVGNQVSQKKITKIVDKIFETFPSYEI
jgi:hypothetical protein